MKWSEQVYKVFSGLENLLNHGYPSHLFTHTQSMNCLARPVKHLVFMVQKD
jgi:hypothetical protein